MDNVTDPSLGVRYASTWTLPASVERRFRHLLRPPEYPVAETFPRLTFVAVAVECFSSPLTDSALPETSSLVRQCVVMLYWGSFLLGDALTGRVCDRFDLRGDDIQGVCCNRQSGAVFLKLRGTAIALTFPFSLEANRFVEMLCSQWKILHGAALEVEQTREIRHAPLPIRCIPTQEKDYGVRQPPDSQLWALVNHTAADAADRMEHIKATFASVDAATKEVGKSIEIDQQQQAALSGEAIANQVQERLSRQADLMAEESRLLRIVELEDNCRKVLEAAQQRRSEWSQLQRNVTVDADKWRTILAEQQAEELHVKRRLTRLQASNRRTLDALESELADLLRQQEQTSQKLSMYQDSAYKEAETQRDLAARRLAEATQEFSEQNRKLSRSNSRRLAEQVDEAIAVNEAYRKMLKQYGRDLQQQTINLERDREVCSANKLALGPLVDDANILKTTCDAAKKRNAELSDMLAQAEQELIPLRNEVADLERSREFFYVAKTEHRKSSLRREEIERSLKMLRATHTSQGLELLLSNMKLDLALRHA